MFKKKNIFSIYAKIEKIIYVNYLIKKKKKINKKSFYNYFFY